MDNERVVDFRPRTIFMLSGILLGIAVSLWIVWIARSVFTWILVALFLALAIDPAVRGLQNRGIRRRGTAAGVVYVIILLVIAAAAAVFIPTLVSQINHFVNAVPGYVHDLTKGRGPFGFLETKYHVVERVRNAIQGKGSGSGLSGGLNAAVDVTRSIATGVAGVITIAFMTFFMLLEGPGWIERGFTAMEPDTEARWRVVGERIYRIVGGYITGNLAISAIAAAASTVVLLIMSVPYPLALGLLVFVLDLIPLAGATIAAVVLVLVALTQSVTAAIVVGVFFIVYQQIENHLLQPLVYGRTVRISPLVALISVLIGAEVAGVLGALGAIPIAASLQVILLDWQTRRRAKRSAALVEPSASDTPSSQPIVQP
jgi:predicted PurR-regulated permease PerM